MRLFTAAAAQNQKCDMDVTIFKQLSEFRLPGQPERACSSSSVLFGSVIHLTSFIVRWIIESHDLSRLS